MATEPVLDWASDYDIFDGDYVADPTPVWSELRAKCPVAHTERWGGSWLPTRYEDVVTIAHDVDRFSSREITVAPRAYALDSAPNEIKAPPISSDPPEHLWARRLILPGFSPKSVAKYEASTRDLCRSLIDGFISTGHADAAENYAQQIPVRVIAQMLGIDESMSDQFTTWVRGVLELGLQDPPLRQKSREELIGFFAAEIAKRKENPSDDLISELLAAEVDGRPVPDVHILGTLGLLLIAGIDTTWSSIGSSLWHLATHPEDRARLAREPELIPTAIEEFLRAYSPVTMARIVNEDTDVNGACMHAGDRVLLNFPAANRDPDAFPDADRVIIDREVNRHVAFGVGIHRCAGSNLARMELRIALEEWLARIPEFRLADGAIVTWAGGQVRGPRQLPVIFP
ncbi:MAG TPA: cytochrome P450 [Acidimicrobiales bacterium]|nr:cytochrome P450 [Acidimicrobiales bacterium]